MSLELKHKMMGAIVFVITISVCLVFVASVLVPLWQQIPMSDTRASVVEGVSNMLISIISMYVGSEIRARAPVN